MPTSNPRITITLEPSVAAQLRRMSQLTGNSQSSMVSEILMQSSSVFERLITVLEAAEKAQIAAREESAERLKDAQEKVERQLGLVFDFFESAEKTLLDEAERISRRRARVVTEPAISPRARAAAKRPSTPLSNRGVRSAHGKVKNQATARVSGELKQKSYKHANPPQKLDKSTGKKRG